MRQGEDMFARDELTRTAVSAVDTLILLVVPGAMDAGLGTVLFRASLAFALLVAFLCAVPVNRCREPLAARARKGSCGRPRLPSPARGTRHPMIRRLPLPIALLTALAIGACGGGEDPTGTSLDRGFAAEMVPHHESAIAMAEVARRRGGSPFVKRLAADILESQTAEVGTLRREDAQLAEAGVERGKLGLPGHMMGMDDDPATLEAGGDFDRRFLEMMVPHHEGAVRMAEVELAKGRDPELKALAEDIKAAQRREIAAMRSELAGT